MGLDDVELVMDIEEKFNVQLPDNILGEARTVGDLYLYLMGLLENRLAMKKNRSKNAEGPCASSHLFYRVRRFFQAETGIPKKEFRLEQPLDRLIPWWRRRSVWAQFRKETGFSLPLLERPDWLVKSIMALIGLFMTGDVLIGIFVVGDVSNSIGAAAWTGISMAILAYFVAKPLAVCFPSQPPTVRNLIEILLVTYWPQFVTEIDAKTSKIVWDTLLQTLEEITNIPKQDIKWESTWYGDLGMG